ncbi:MAG: hypothetical protein IT192_02855 [Microbacteriaceae bacterium]|nr:hypothetical protein [Microbacteriaceae bacterium]
MKRLQPLSIIVGLMLAAASLVLVPTSAIASPQSAFGGTFDVQLSVPNTPSILGGVTSYVRISSPTPMYATTSEVQTSAVDVQLLDSSSQELLSCQIQAGSSGCSLGSVQLVAGTQSASIHVTNGTETHDYPVTFFGVTPIDSAQTTVGLEWQDALGNWNNGTGVGTYMLESQVTSYRFWIRNNTNAPITVNSFDLNLVHTQVNIVIQPGATTYFAGGGPALASALPNSVTAIWVYVDAAGYSYGNGTGGGLALLPGSAVLSTSTADPGDMVDLTGTDFTDSNLSQFDAYFNSSPVLLGSVAADQAGGFHLSFAVPADATPGLHHVTLMKGNYAVAALPITIAGLAATGVDPIPYILIAGILLLAGVLFLALRMLVRRKSQDS